MKYWIAFLTMVLGVFPARIAFGDEAKAPVPSASLHTLRASGSQIEGVVTLRAAGDLTPSLFSTDKKEEISSSTHRQPLDLWLVLDNSALCAKYQADQTLSAWAKKLAAELPSDSKLSLLTFRRGSFEMLATQQNLGALPLNKARCQAGAVSSEPERALAYISETEVPEGLTRAVWILSSGNATISKRMQQRLAETDTELSFFLYNPIVFPALSSLFDSIQSTLGGGLFFAGVATADLPARTFAIKASIPSGLGQSAGFAATVGSGEKAVQSNSVTIRLPKNAGPTFWEKVALAFLYMGLTGLAIYGVVRLVRHYRPKHCAVCKKRMRHRDTTCPFCFESEGAYLLANNPLGEGVPVAAALLTPLYSAVTQVGTHRRSALRCLRHTGERRRVFFKVHRQGNVFRLHTGVLPVFVNGIPVENHRYLASGDEIQAGQSVFKFVMNQRSSQSA